MPKSNHKYKIQDYENIEFEIRLQIEHQTFEYASHQSHSRVLN